MNKNLFQEKNKLFLEKALKTPKRINIAVTYPLNEQAIEGAILAYDLGLIDPIFIGPQDKMNQLAKKIGKDLSKHTILDASDSSAAAKKAVELVK